jgi:hypothetical protein
VPLAGPINCAVLLAEFGIIAINDCRMQINDFRIYRIEEYRLTISEFIGLKNAD